MKKHFFLIILLTGGILALTQQALYGQNCDYSQIMDEGKQAFESKDYQEAIKKFRAGEACCEIEKINNCEAGKWVVKSQEAYVNALESEKNKLELAANAYKYALNNPTHAFRIAQYAVEKDPTNEAAREQYLNLLKDYPFSFYSKILKHDGNVADCSVSPDGKSIATASWDHKVRLWDSKGDLLQIFPLPADSLKGHQEPVHAVCFSPDGKFILSGGMDNNAILWNIDGTIARKLEGHEGDITGLAFSPDGKIIATCSWDQTIRIWDMNGIPIKVIEAHEGFINDLALSHSGDKIATASWDEKVKVWDLNGMLLATMEGHIGPVTSVDFSKDDRNLLSTGWDAKIYMWDIDQQRVVQSFAGHTGIVFRARFSPKGDAVLSVGQDHTARLWNLNGNELQDFRYHHSTMQAIAFDPNDEFLVIGSRDKKASIWFYRGQLVDTYQFEGIKNITNVAVNPTNGDILFSSGKQAFLADKNGRIKRKLADHKYNIRSVCTSDDGKYLLTGDFIINVYNAEGDSVTQFREHRNYLFNIAVSTKNNIVASVDRSNVIRLWNYEGEEVLVKECGKGRYLVDVCFSPDEDLIAIGGSSGKVYLMDLEGNIVNEFLSHDEGWVTTLSFSSDGKRIAASGSGGYVRIWSLDGELIMEFKAHPGLVNSLAYSPDGKTMLTTSRGGEATLWDAEGRAIQQLAGHRSEIPKGVFFDNNQMITASIDGTMKRWLTIVSMEEDGLIYQLESLEKFEYDFDVDTTGLTGGKAEKTDMEESSQAFNFRRIEEYQKAIFAFDDPADYYLWVSFEYSEKAYQSTSLAEKIALEGKGIEFHDRYGLNSSLFQKGHFYGRLGLWYLGKKDLQNARESINGSLAYFEKYDEKQLAQVKNILALVNLRKALLHIYENEWEKAELLINENARVNLKTGNLNQLHSLTSDEEYPDDATGKYQLLKDIDFLESVGAGHPDFKKVRALINP